MGCGCAGRPPAMPRTGGGTQRVPIYEVVSGDGVVLRTTSATAARTEAKITGGTVRVSSEPVDAANAPAG